MNQTLVMTKSSIDRRMNNCDLNNIKPTFFSQIEGSRDTFLRGKTVSLAEIFAVLRAFVAAGILEMSF